MAEQKKEPDDIDYLVMALALSGICVNRITAEIIIATYESIGKKHGKFNVEDVVNIEWRIRRKHIQITAEKNKK
jgi:hypothetical protein